MVQCKSLCVHHTRCDLKRHIIDLLVCMRKRIVQGGFTCCMQTSWDGLLTNWKNNSRRTHCTQIIPNQCLGCGNEHVHNNAIYSCRSTTNKPLFHQFSQASSQIAWLQSWVVLSHSVHPKKSHSCRMDSMAPADIKTNLYMLVMYKEGENVTRSA